jgi:hypothetical protein
MGETAAMKKRSRTVAVLGFGLQLGLRLGVVGVAAASAAAGVAAAGCSTGPVALQAPNIAPSAAREPTPVDLEPIAAGAGIEGDFVAPGPAAVLTAAMKAELAGRALRGGDPGGYAVRCTLDRFTLRTHESVMQSEQMTALYADLSCEAKRARDGAPVWRGELRGRTCAASSNVLGSDSSTTLRLANRAMSDAARELASDLALRALGLLADPSARVFADEDAQRAGAGLDDTPFGSAALEENTAAVEHALRSAKDHDPVLRAAAWNVAAMASGPGEPWPGDAKLELDEHPMVRFEQYKALARLATPSSLTELEGAAQREGDPLLAQLLRDSLASEGIGLARSGRPSRTPAP